MHTKSSKAFTMMEVVIALAIMAIALGGLLRLHLTSMTVADKAYARMQASLLAQAKLNALLVSNSLETMPFSGTQVQNQIPFQWEAHIDRSTFDLGTQHSLRRVRVRVTWPQGQQEQKLELSSILAGEDSS